MFPEENAGRIEYKYGWGTEIYEHRPEGVEQLFELTSAACPARTATIRLGVSLEGARARRMNSVDASISLGFDGLRYGKLHVVDRDGKVVPSRMELRAETVDLVLDVRNVRWPILVDPLVWQSQPVLPDPDTRQHGAAILQGDQLFWSDFDSQDNLDIHGKIHVLKRDGNLWQQRRTLELKQQHDEFGASFDVNGIWMIASATGANADDLLGGVFLANASTGVWGIHQKLDVPAGVEPGGFGDIVKIDDTFALIAAHGQKGGLFIYKNNDGNWSPFQLLPIPANSMITSVSLEGSRVVVGATQVAQVLSHFITVFALQNGSWVVESTIPPPADNTTSFEQGNRLLLRDPWLFVGTPTTLSLQSPSTPLPGAIYAYKRNGTSWILKQQITPAETKMNDGFGASFSLDGGDLYVAYGSTQSVRIYREISSKWTEVEQISAPPLPPKAVFGAAVSASNERVAITGYNEFGSPQTYLYARAKAVGEPCAENSECAVACVSGVCCDQLCNDGCGVCTIAKGATQDGICSPASKGSTCNDYWLCDGEETACPSKCSMDGCVDGYVCEFGKCTKYRDPQPSPAPTPPAPVAPVAEDSGCALTARSSSWQSWLLVGGLGLLWRRRRRS